jgi:tRNA A37 threonylcarbamoyladenosine biosynthesis protein TsaE
LRTKKLTLLSILFQIIANNKIKYSLHYKIRNENHFSLDEIEDTARKIVANNPNKVIFHGDMGAGKTTFIKQLAKELELWKRQVAQPFFS